jgi:GntR family transcriptional regulator
MEQERLAAPRPADRGLPTPLYHQIYLVLAENIRSGKWRPGETIPTEREICETFQVSRITARQALQQLVQEGAIERRRGSGSRVAARFRPAPRADDLDTLMRRVADFGARTTGVIHEYGLRQPPAEVAATLKLVADTKVHYSQHTRLLDVRPIGLIAAWVPADLAVGFTRAAVAKTPVLTLLQRAGARIAWADQTVTATLADSELARRLDVPLGAPLLRLVRTVFDADDRPIELLDARYRADSYAARVRLGRNARAWPAES